MRRAAKLFGLIAILGTQLACNETGVVVAIHSFLKIPTELDAICLQVAAGGGWEFSRRYPLAEEDAGSPRTLSVLAGEKNADRFEVLLRGERRGWPVSFQRVTMQFREHEVATEHLYLPICAGSPERVKPGTGRFPASTIQGTLATGATAAAAVPVAFAPGQMMTVSPEPRRFAWLPDDKGEKRVWMQAQGMPKNSDAISRLIVVDLDNDCDLDLVALSAAGPRVWRQLDGGAYEEIPNAIYLTDVFSAGAAADFNRDGYQDLVLVSASSVKLLLNDAGTPGRFIDSSTSIQGVTGGGIAVAVGLLDADGNPDVVLVKGSSSASQVLASNPGDATAPLRISPSAIGLSDKNTQSVAVADLDNDGLQDLVLGGSSGAVVLLNSKLNPGTFTSSELPGTAGSDVRELHVADLDNDCRRDLVVGAADGVKILLNTGKAVFSEAPAVEAPPTPSTQLSSVDVDGDGLLDLIMVGGGIAKYHLQQAPGS